MSTRFGVFARSRDLVVATDGDGHIVFRNPAAASRFAPGVAVANVFPAEVRAAFERVATGEPGASCEWSIDESGTRTWLSTEITPIDGGALAVSRDISVLKRTEERLRAAEKMLVDAQGVAHLGTWEWDISRPNATWSAELYRIYGLTPEAYSPSYDAYLKMVHDDDRQRVIDATNRVFHEHVPYSHDERIFRPDGSMRYLHTWAFPVLDETGKLTHLIGVCQDITDRALAEEGLQRANAELEDRVAERTNQLEAALHDLEAFNSMVSHDLRAPLAVIQMAVDLLAKDGGVAEGRMKYLERIERAVTTMAKLLDDLLAFARVGEAAMRPVEIDVSGLASEVMAELQASSTARSAMLLIEPGLRVTADPALFRIVLANLLGNAWKYTQKRPNATIEVGLAARPQGNVLYVRDNGIGFDMAEYDKLFTPFERLKTAAEFKGTGVGLATVQRILLRHGGSIAAESKPNEGATFYISLPSAHVATAS